MMLNKTDLKLIQELGLSTAFNFQKEKMNKACYFKVAIKSLTIYL